MSENFDFKTGCQRINSTKYSPKEKKEVDCVKS